MRNPLLSLVFGLALVLPGTSWSAELDTRIQAVGQAIEEADDMYNTAKKGHLPSLQAINSLRAQLMLAKDLHAGAKDAVQANKKYDAGAKLDAAEFLAKSVYEASKH